MFRVFLCLAAVVKLGGLMRRFVPGTLVMLDMAREFKVSNLVFASSSSVYGQNQQVPFSESDRVDDPVCSSLHSLNSLHIIFLTSVVLPSHLLR